MKYNSELLTIIKEIHFDLFGIYLNDDEGKTIIKSIHDDIFPICFDWRNNDDTEFKEILYDYFIEQ